MSLKMLDLYSKELINRSHVSLTLSIPYLDPHRLEHKLRPLAGIRVYFLFRQDDSQSEVSPIILAARRGGVGRD